MQVNKGEIFHSIPEFLVRGRDVKLSFAFLCDLDKKSAFLRVFGQEKSKKKSGYKDIGVSFIKYVTFCARKYTVAYFDLPGELTRDIAGEELEYSIVLEKNEIKKYNVKLCENRAMPDIIVTELSLRPGEGDAKKFLEIFNTCDHPIDLYEYEIEINDDSERIRMSDERGKDILAPREYAVWRPIYPSVHETLDGKYLDNDEFISFCLEGYCDERLESKRDSIKIVKRDISCPDEKNPGKYRFIDRVSAFCTDVSDDPYNIRIFRCGEEKEFYTLSYYMKPGRIDAPVRRSSLWSIRLEDPENAVKVCYYCPMTPGYSDERYKVPSIETSCVPLLVPIDTDKEIYIADGDATIRFGALDTDKLGDTVLYFLDGKNKCAVKESKRDPDGVIYYDIPWDIIKTREKLEFYVVSDNGTYYSDCGAESSPLSLNVYDNDGPELVSSVPSSEYAFDDREEIIIHGKYYDLSGIDRDMCEMYIDGKRVSGVKWGKKEFSYKPDKSLKLGKHRMKLMLFDMLGNLSVYKIRFSVAAYDDMKFYRGEIHAHSMGSDGSGLTDEAIRYARDVGGVDFFSLTEHSHYLDRDRYDEQIKISDSFNAPGSFVSLYGWEMNWTNTTGYWGHMNAIGSKLLCNDFVHTNLPEFFDFMKKDPDAVLMFNHPQYMWGNFDEYSHRTEESDRQVCLAEIKGGMYDTEYSKALSTGWHVSPAYSEDNHKPNWTTAVPSTTYVLAQALTRENILEAFRKRRTYSSADPTMKVNYKLCTHYLGSRIKRPEKLEFDIHIETESEQGIGIISIVGEDNIIVAQANVGALTKISWKPTLPPDFDYYYLKITSPDGKLYTVTAPVWLEGGNMLNITDLSLGENDNDSDEYKPTAARVEFGNYSDKKMNGAKVEFYLSKEDGFDISRSSPYATVYAGDLGSGEIKEVAREFPNLYGYRRLSVVVSGYIGKKKFVDTKFMMISDLVISEVLPQSPEYKREDGTVFKNAFSYLVIRNYSRRDVSLDDCVISLWVKTGHKPVAGENNYCSLAKTGMIAKAGKSIVIWQRPEDSDLTDDDFNRVYGTSFSYGDGFYAVGNDIVSANLKRCARIDLIKNGELLSRIKYNFGDSWFDPEKREINEDTVGKSLIFRRVANMSAISELALRADHPIPGKLYRAQKLEAVDCAEKRSERKAAKAAKKLSEKQKKNEAAKKVKKSSATVASVAASALSLALGVTAGAIATATVLKKKK